VDLDYADTFSSIIWMASLRLFLAIAAALDLDLCQFDIDIAFLYAPLKEDVYIRQPLGFTDGTLKVSHLKRSPLLTARHQAVVYVTVLLCDCDYGYMLD
jgi:hypothetical protein